MLLGCKTTTAAGATEKNSRKDYRALSLAAGALLPIACVSVGCGVCLGKGTRGGASSAIAPPRRESNHNGNPAIDRSTRVVQLCNYLCGAGPQSLAVLLSWRPQSSQLLSVHQGGKLIRQLRYTEEACFDQVDKCNHCTSEHLCPMALRQAPTASC